jgi:opacity protein-like surface antigen
MHLKVQQFKTKRFRSAPKSLAATFILTCVSWQANAESVYITPMVGFSNGLEVKAEDGNSYKTKSDLNYNLAVEVPFQQGRVGFIYSEHNSELDSPAIDNTLRYLQFQSSLYYPVAEHLSSYIGLGLGGTQLSSNWYDTDYLFSGSAFGGLEYQMSRNIALQAQVRWFGSLLSSDTASVCNYPSDEGGGCKFYFSGDWLSQVQGNVGITIRF